MIQCMETGYVLDIRISKSAHVVDELSARSCEGRDRVHVERLKAIVVFDPEGFMIGVIARQRGCYSVRFNTYSV